MKGLRITTKDIAGFREHLILEERSAATIQKYIRDVKAFTEYANGAVTKETVIAYKKHLQEHYAVRSVNSMLASINSLLAFLGWHDLRVKALKLQQQVYCPEEKELTKAEYTRLCQAAQRRHNERLNLILQTICGTGSANCNSSPWKRPNAVRRWCAARVRHEPCLSCGNCGKNCSATQQSRISKAV